MKTIITYDMLFAFQRKYGGYCYLASPYWSPLHQLRKCRAEAAIGANAMLLRMGIRSFSPIAHSYDSSISRHLKGCEISHEQFMELDIELLRHAKWCIVLKLEGWRESKGVTQELKFCEENSIPVFGVRFEKIAQCYDKHIALEYQRNTNGGQL